MSPVVLGEDRSLKIDWGPREVGVEQIRWSHSPLLKFMSLSKKKQVLCSGPMDWKEV